MKNIEETLLRAARQSGLSMRELSLRADLHYSSVHAFVRDGKGITLRSAAALAEVLGLELKPAKTTKRASSKGGRNG